MLTFVKDCASLDRSKASVTKILKGKKKMWIFNETKTVSTRLKSQRSGRSWHSWHSWRTDVADTATAYKLCSNYIIWQSAVVICLFAYVLILLTHLSGKFKSQLTAFLSLSRLICPRPTFPTFFFRIFVFWKFWNEDKFFELIVEAIKGKKSLHICLH